MVELESSNSRYKIQEKMKSINSAEERMLEEIGGKL
jgi:hypothetical protein